MFNNLSDDFLLPSDLLSFSMQRAKKKPQSLNFKLFKAGFFLGTTVSVLLAAPRDLLLLLSVVCLLIIHIMIYYKPCEEVVVGRSCKSSSSTVCRQVVVSKQKRIIKYVRRAYEPLCLLPVIVGGFVTTW